MYKLKLNSFYLCVKDVKRAVNFYEQLLNQKVENNGLFIINGIRLMLLDYQSVNHDRVVFGHNCLPSFEVSNIKAFMEKLDELKAEIIFPCTRIGNNWVLEFKDTEGNPIEAYSKYRPLEDEPDDDYRFH
jgi:predicted enzyme related to lactoylglutathione lyase